MVGTLRFAQPTKWLPRLFRQQREGTILVLRRRVFLIAADSRLVQIIEQLERMGVVGPAAALDRRERAIPVAAAITCQHLDGQVAQSLEAAGLRGVLAPRDGIDDLGLLLALHHDEVEFEDRELLLDRKRGFGA